MQRNEYFNQYIKLVWDRNVFGIIMEASDIVHSLTLKKITLHPGIPSFTHISPDVSYIRKLSGSVYPQAECNGSQARDLIKRILVCGEKGTWAGSILRRCTH